MNVGLQVYKSPMNSFVECGVTGIPDGLNDLEQQKRRHKLGVTTCFTYININ